MCVYAQAPQHTCENQSFPTFMYALEIQLRSSNSSASAFTHRTISAEPRLILVVYNREMYIHLSLCIRPCHVNLSSPFKILLDVLLSWQSPCLTVHSTYADSEKNRNNSREATWELQRKAFPDSPC